MDLFFNRQLKNIEIYSLPLAAFFVLISTSVFNFFIVLALIFGVLTLIREKEYSNNISKKFMLYGILIFIFLFLSAYYTNGGSENVITTLKKYLKLLYLPILFYHIKSNQNQLLIVKFLILGSMIILLFSYLQFFHILNFSLINNFLNFELFKIMNKASVSQTSIIHGVIFSLIFYLSIYMAIKFKNKFYFIYSFLCFSNVMFINDSRNAYIVSFFLIFLVIYYLFKRKRYIGTTVSLLLVFSLSSSAVLETTFLKTLNEGYQDITLLNKKNFTSSIGLRALWAINGLNNITLKPLFGSGVGSYEYTIKNFIEKNNINVDKGLAISNNPHNEYVSMSTQLGLFGFLLYLLFMYSLFKESRKNFLASGVFVITFVSSIFNSAFYDNVLGLFLILSISLFYQKDFEGKI